jgi:hypothetical protein
VISTAQKEINPQTKNQGWFSDKGPDFVTNENYFAGYLKTAANPPTTVHGFFTFDPSAITGVVTSARLDVQLSSSKSPDATETVGFFDVDTNAELLNRKQFDLGIFEDLGTGNLYATKDVAIGSPFNTILQVPLNTTGVADINSHVGGYFLIGTSLITLSSRGVDEFVFGSSQIPPNEVLLTLEVIPEPSTFAMLAIGSLGICLHRKRRLN